MNLQEKERTNRTGLWLVLLLTLFAWAPTTYPGYWKSLEGFAPIFNAAFPHPIANIATSADLWRGAGNATFILTQPFLVLGLSPLVAVRITFALCFVLGALGTYIWLRPRLGDRGAALAAVIYALLPPFLATVYVRGSLSDALILGLLPLTLAGLAAYTRTRAPSAIGVAVIATLWMWRTQAGLALLATLMLLAYVLWVERDRLALIAMAVTGVAGGLSLLPIWQIRAPAPVRFDQHFVYLFQLLGNGWAVAPSVPGWQDRYPFQLGFAAIAFSVATAWLIFLRSRNAQVADEDEADRPPPAPLFPLDRLLPFSFVVVFVGITLSLGVSAPLWRWTNAQRLLTYPWQVLLVIAPFLAVTAGSLPALNARLRCRAYWVALLVLTLMSSYPFLTTEFTQFSPPDAPVAVFGKPPKLVLLKAEIDERSGSDQTEPTAELAAAWQLLQPLEFDYNVFFQALRNEEGSTTFDVVAQLDRQPLGDEQPATTWPVGQIFTQTYRLELPVDPNGVHLRYYFGYYDWQDGSRLPVDGGVEDKVVLYGQ